YFFRFCAAPLTTGPCGRCRDPRSAGGASTRSSGGEGGGRLGDSTRLLGVPRERRGPPRQPPRRHGGGCREDRPPERRGDLAATATMLAISWATGASAIARPRDLDDALDSSASGESGAA